MTNHEHEQHSEHHGHSHTKTTGTAKPSITNVILLISAGILLFAGGFKVGQMKGSSANSQSRFVNTSSDFARNEQAAEMDFSLFWETWNKLEEKYVDQKKLSTEKMFYGAIKGMVASVEDPYTFFLTPEENQKSKDDLGGKFEGIGAQLGLKEGQILVVAPIKNSPAERAGVKAGDIIVKINGESAQGLSLNEVVGKIRGEKGTKVKITMLRAGKEIDFEIARDTIQVESVELNYEDSANGKIAVIKINQFGDTTNREWDQAASEVAQRYQSKEIAGMVLDLRDNPGGYLESSVYIASEFLPIRSVIVKQESTIEPDRTYTVRREGRLQNIPVVTLINRGSASASEILSGALRDYNRTELVGEKSFGKGSVQEALDLDKGAGLHVTVAKWILPKGDWINGKGIQVAHPVENTVPEGNTMSREYDKQLDKALELVTVK